MHVRNCPSTGIGNHFLALSGKVSQTPKLVRDDLHKFNLLVTPTVRMLGICFSVLSCRSLIFFQPTVVGLTGGIATGKSTVAALLASHDIPIIDADLIARRVVEPGTRAHKQIVKAFGKGVLLPSSVNPTHFGSDLNSDEQDWYTRPIDRKKLGSIIFNDEKQRKILNRIVHPAVTRATVWGVLKAWVRGEKVVVVDVPLLIEGGLWKWMGRIIVVYWYVWISLVRFVCCFTTCLC